MKLILSNAKLRNGRKVIFRDKTMEVSFNKLQIQGENGSGKTTLLNRIYHKRDGISVDGSSVNYINQKLVLLMNMSIKDNVELLAPDNSSDIIIEFLSIFQDIEITTIVKKLSGGQKQMLNFLIGFSQPKDLYIIDEPFNNVDNEKREIIREKLIMTKSNLIVVAHGYSFDFCETKLKLEEGELELNE